MYTLAITIVLVSVLEHMLSVFYCICVYIYAKCLLYVPIFYGSCSLHVLHAPVLTLLLYVVICVYIYIVCI
jgi:hypothetical protein